MIICGFGTKGQSAVRTLRDKGCKQSEIVVIDERSDARSKATSQGLAAVAGSVTSTDTLAEAGIDTARAIVVAVDRDDTGGSCHPHRAVSSTPARASLRRFARRRTSTCFSKAARAR